MTSFYGSVNGGAGGEIDTSQFLQKNNPAFDGTITGPNANFTETVNVPEPTEDGNAANKGYVDAAVASAGGGASDERLDELETKIDTKLDKNNPAYTGALSGDVASFNTLTIGGDNAATEEYVDAATAGLASQDDLDALNTAHSGLAARVDTKLDKANPAYEGTLTGGDANFSGSVTVPSPKVNGQAANKQYVDLAIAEAQIGGDGEVDLSSIQEDITNLQNEKANLANPAFTGTATLNGQTIVTQDQLPDVSGLTGRVDNIENGTTELPYLKENNPTYEGTLIGGDATFTGSVQVSTPTEDNQAANKSYVDSAVAGISGEVDEGRLTAIEQKNTEQDEAIAGLQTADKGFVKKSGDTMDGLLTLNQGLKNVNTSDPSQETNLSPNVLSFKYNSTVKMLGMQSNKLKFTDSGASNLVPVEVGTPVEDNDATNKKYVDNAINQLYHMQVLAAKDKETVDNLFVSWWKAKWADGITTYNSMLEDWFANVLYDDRVHGAKLPLWETSHSQQGEYTDDSVGLVCQTSTAEQAGRDDFAHLPQFWCVEVAVEKNADYTHTIYACEFIDDINIVRAGGPDNGKHLVWVLQKNTYRREWEEEGYKYIKIRCTPAAGYNTWLQGTDNRGRVYPYVGIPKYAAGLEEDGTIGSRYGIAPAIFESYSTSIQKWRARGSQYAGGSYLTLKWQLDMIALKYAMKGNSNILEGCVSFHKQVPIQVAETSANRVLINTDQAENFIVGQYINIGAGTRNAVEPRRLITNIETVNVSETDYLALSFGGEPINTTTDQYVMTLSWTPGIITSQVRGNDGQDVKGQTKTALIQKTEIMPGSYLINADEKWRWDSASDHEDGSRTFECYICNDADNINADNNVNGYTLVTSINIPADYDNTNKFITDMVVTNEQVVFPKALSAEAGSTTGVGDSMQIYLADNAIRAPWHCGSLWLGAAAGLCWLASSKALSPLSWDSGVSAPGLAR